MSIFRRDPPLSTHAVPRAPQRSDEAAEQRKAGPARQGGPTVIAAGTRVTGEVTGSADLQIEGELQATVTLDAEVVVGAGGRAEGRISARRVRIGGRVHGEVHGTELVELTPSGSLEGDITAARVVIAEGAFFKGKVEMPGTGDPASKARRRQSASRPAAATASPAEEHAARSPLFPEPDPQGG